ncbi:MAG: NERD domain-containing protein [Fibrobacter sp.]|nr:NERD domain-containing protein [Fibrobacter sp.]
MFDSLFGSLTKLLLLAIGLSVVFSLVNATLSKPKKKRRRRNYQRERNFVPEENRSPRDNVMGCGCALLLVLFAFLGVKFFSFIWEHPIPFFLLFGACFALLVFIANQFPDKTSEKPQPPELEKSPDDFTSDASSFDYAQEVGKAGEDAIEKVIHQVCAENRRRYQLLRNVYLPKGNGETSEIDLLLLHETGMYVFESKNVSGAIYGDDSHPQWIVYKRNGDQERMTNPVRQNEGHIKYLLQFLGQDPWASRVYNVVVFGAKSNIKQVPQTRTFTSIHTIRTLPGDLSLMLQNGKNFYSPETVDALYDKIQPYVHMVDDDVTQTHIEQVSRRFGKFN